MTTSTHATEYTLIYACPEKLNKNFNRQNIINLASKIDSYCFGLLALYILLDGIHPLFMCLPEDIGQQDKSDVKEMQENFNLEESLSKVKDVIWDSESGQQYKQLFQDSLQYNHANRKTIKDIYNF